MPSLSLLLPRFYEITCLQDKVTLDGLATRGKKVVDQIRHGQNVVLAIPGTQDGYPFFSDRAQIRPS